MLKQTTEFAAIPAKFIDSTTVSLADGKLNFGDFTNYFDDILAAQAGIAGMNEIPEENAKASVEERKQFQDAIEAQMPNVPADERYDYANAMAGMFSIARIFWRKGYEKGLEKARTEMQTEKDL